MSIVSITRFRLRGLRYLPFFMIHAQRSLMQIRRADGYLAGAVRRDRNLAYWTARVWRDESALLAYVTSSDHRTAMPKLADWGDEASTVRWDQDGFDLPDWSVAIESMQREGRALPLRHPAPTHATVSFAESRSFQTSRI
jgi:hypothetical protein